MARGRLFVLSAPSGGGKTTLAEALMRDEPRLARSVSHTTRPPRPGERDGVDYFFVDGSTFERMVAAGEFLEHATVFGNRYGTARAAVEALRAQGRDVLLVIDWQGARRVKQLLPEACTVFLLPPSRAELESRLRGRGQDSEEVIRRRLAESVAEMRHYPEFDHVVVNDAFEAALADLKAIVRGEPGRARPLRLDLERLLAE
jgi:guanylate kinase